MVGLLFLESVTDIQRFGRSSGLLLSTPSSHATMAPHSDVTDWVSTLELTAAGLRRTLTGFPLGTLAGDQIGRKNTKKKQYPKENITTLFSFITFKI
jgi:hypothetical protein